MIDWPTGFCWPCNRQVDLDEDGLLIEHRTSYSEYGKILLGKCRGSGREPYDPETFSHETESEE